MRLIEKRRLVQLEHDSVGREVAHEIQGQELGRDADPGSSLTDQLLEPDLAEGIERDARRCQRLVVDERQLGVAAGIDKLVSLDGLLAVEDRLPG